MRTIRKNHLAATAGLAVVACGITACAGSPSPPITTEAGGSATPASDTDAIVLTIGTSDLDTMPGAGQIKHFAQQVSERSEGAITLEPQWDAARNTSHWDQAVARMLLDGDLDLAMIPSRAWDDLGVTSLRALNAPFLITTDTLTEKVVTDPELVEQLTSGLPDVGVEALGVFPEGLRHPFGVQGALGGPDDYEGGVVRAGWSRTADAMFRALGASTDDARLDASTMIGAESSYRLTPAGTATGNVVFYPKINVLTLSAAVQLTPEQRTILEEAAGATADWVLDSLPTDAESARTYCTEGGRIAGAKPAEIAALVTATRGVVEDLRADETTAALIDAITELAQEDPTPERVTSCPEHEADRAGDLNGVYTFSATEEAIRAAGGTDQATIDEDTGDFTVTFDDGTWSMEQVYSQGPSKGTTWHGSGRYSYDGVHFQIFYGHEPGKWTKARVEIRKNGSLEFSDVVDGEESEFQAIADVWYTTWPRVSD
jgi:TRAP-type C4-dicarboxylate transport system substrate-binding protein